ncbi:uncharacterized protein TM35_000181810 [Trypanosoma theileri]|uniref:Uncharacterized protein n=1 Tax=Trypanosoma theileri TaxID=67003 RepID=A0A1X0NTU3_9TRYP|nr:uncharacterized protein TM35_000181810 [Trypanosoma theileri]ORC88124.1 hypothetical protein TM35_000181810 [Trypanosoma theileri]
MRYPRQLGVGAGEMHGAMAFAKTLSCNQGLLMQHYHSGMRRRRPHTKTKKGPIHMQQTSLLAFPIGASRADALEETRPISLRDCSHEKRGVPAKIVQQRGCMWLCVQERSSQTHTQYAMPSVS